MLYKRPVEILLIEDNPADWWLTQHALDNGVNSYRLLIAKDGKEALDLILNCDGPSMRPDLILLDLNLPGLNGHEVLRKLKTDEQTRQIPVIIWSSSSEQNDIFEAYNLHANCYVQKPSTLDELYCLFAAIEAFWLQAAKLPARRHLNVYPMLPGHNPGNIPGCLNEHRLP